MRVKELFQNVKNAIRQDTKTTISQRSKAIDRMMERAVITDQKLLLDKLKTEKVFLKKRATLIEAGYQSYIRRSDLEKYADLMAKEDSRHVAIVELDRYLRDIPEEVVKKIGKAKEYFDKFTVMYTDFSDNLKELENEREIEKDPIVFGIVTSNDDTDQWSEDYYVIADWQDEYCDLDLSTYIDEYSKKIGVDKKDILKDANDYVVGGH